jgi:hypothetical protein
LSKVVDQFGRSRPDRECALVAQPTGEPRIEPAKIFSLRQLKIDQSAQDDYY